MYYLTEQEKINYLLLFTADIQKLVEICDNCVQRIHIKQKYSVRNM